MSKKFYAINRETGRRWEPINNEYLVMYDTGSLAVVSPGWYIDIKPLDTKIWEMVVKPNILPAEKINDNALLIKNGWTVECEGPFEIRHEDGSFATLHAAKIVVDYLKRGLE